MLEPASTSGSLASKSLILCVFVAILLALVAILFVFLSIEALLSSIAFLFASIAGWKSVPPVEEMVYVIAPFASVVCSTFVLVPAATLGSLASTFLM